MASWGGPPRGDGVAADSSRARAGAARASRRPATRITFRAPECPTTWMIRLPGWPGRPAPPESDRRGWAMAPPAEGRDVHCGGRSFEPFATDGVDDRWRVVCARRL